MRLTTFVVNIAHFECSPSVCSLIWSASLGKEKCLFCHLSQKRSAAVLSLRSRILGWAPQLSSPIFGCSSIHGTDFCIGDSSSLISFWLSDKRRCAALKYEVVDDTTESIVWCYERFVVSECGICAFWWLSHKDKGDLQWSRMKNFKSVGVQRSLRCRWVER